jgi:tryptophan-rich sensory protein
MSRVNRWQPVAVAALAALAVALLGGLMTDMGPWYRGLDKPWFQPPDWAFGPAWTVIYALAAVSAVAAWRAGQNKAQRETMLVLFALNAFVNVLWSLLFFRLRRPDWALIEVGFLWASVLLLIVVLGRCSRTAALLLVPYLAWVSFASVLNWATVQLNPPFGGAA